MYQDMWARFMTEYRSCVPDSYLSEEDIVKVLVGWVADSEARCEIQHDLDKPHDELLERYERTYRAEIERLLKINEGS